MSTVYRGMPGSGYGVYVTIATMSISFAYGEVIVAACPSKEAKGTGLNDGQPRYNTLAEVVGVMSVDQDLADTAYRLRRHAAAGTRQTR